MNREKGDQDPTKNSPYDKSKRIIKVGNLLHNLRDNELTTINRECNYQKQMVFLLHEFKTRKGCYMTCLCEEQL